MTRSRNEPPTSAKTRRQFLTGTATAMIGLAGAPLSGRLPAILSPSVRMRGLDGGSVALRSSALAELESSLSAPLVRPGAAGYDSARQLWNASVDHRPAVIVRAQSVRDVSHTVRFAAGHRLALSVRGGGHNHAGHAVVDGGLVVDLSAMSTGALDADRRTVRVGAGHTFGSFDRLTQQAGLATTGPIVSMVGVGGYTLGGGIGWLHRKLGAGCDNLIGAQLVLPSGEIAEIDENRDADLLWALRGGGGNFGVATRLDFRLHPLSRVFAGLVFYPLDQLGRVGRFVDGFMDEAGDDLNVWLLHRRLPSAPTLPEALHGRPAVIVAITWTGDLDEGPRRTAPLRAIGRPLLDLTKPRPYVEWQSALDGAWGDGFHNEWVGGYLDAYTPELEEVLREHLGAISSPHSDFKLARLGGAFGRVTADQAAFGFRSSRYAYVIQTRWRDERQTRRHLDWTYAFQRALRRVDTGKVYANFIGRHEPSSRHRDAYEGSALARLARLKRLHDPGNLFRSNVNVEPARSGSG